MQIKAHTFLIAGGGSGLGAACTRRLAERQGNVIIADANAKTGQALADELAPRARFIETDVTDTKDVERAAQASVDAFGGLHGAVNCAVIALAERVVGENGPHDLEAFGKVIEVNLIGTFNVTRIVANIMAREQPYEGQERGVIVNTASVAAFDGQVGQAAYSASKGGVVGMTLPIARELARFGIRVMTIAPGIFDTPMLGALSEKVRQSLAEQIPFPSRLGHPEEFAQLVEQIIENEMLNGEVIRLDGALRMASR